MSKLILLTLWLFYNSKSYQGVDVMTSVIWTRFNTLINFFIIFLNIFYDCLMMEMEWLKLNYFLFFHYALRNYYINELFLIIKCNQYNTIMIISGIFQHFSNTKKHKEYTILNPFLSINQHKLEAVVHNLARHYGVIIKYSTMRKIWLFHGIIILKL